MKNPQLLGDVAWTSVAVVVLVVRAVAYTVNVPAEFIRRRTIPYLRRIKGPPGGLGEEAYVPSAGPP
jgi:hypothetical protein